MSAANCCASSEKFSFSGSTRISRERFLHARRDADPAGLGHAFEANRDVYAVTKDVAVLDYDVAHIDADPEVDAFIRRYRRIPFGHLSLYLSGTVQGIHYAAELEEQSIVCRLNDPTAMFLDFGVCHLAPKRF